MAMAAQEYGDSIFEGYNDWWGLLFFGHNNETLGWLGIT